MARNYINYTSRGATIAAVVVDTPPRNAAMVEKLVLPFPILSDPDGSVAIKPLGVWDDAGKIALTSIIIIAPDGREVFRYVGNDFVDRPEDELILGALDDLGLPAIAEQTSTVETPAAVAGPRAMSVETLTTYLRGVRGSSLALTGRMRDTDDRAELERTVKMAERYIAALGATMRAARRAD
jgi:hypothetical protein